MIIPPPPHLKKVLKLNSPLNSLPGIGPKRAKLFAHYDINLLFELLYLLPIRYENRTQLIPIKDVQVGFSFLVKGKVISVKEQRFFGKGKSQFRITIEDDTEQIDLLWFNFKRVYLNQFAQSGMDIFAYGRIQQNRNKKQMIHPQITSSSHKTVKDFFGYYPVYPVIDGVSGNLIRTTILHALDVIKDCPIDIIPVDITGALKLPGLFESIRCLHIPPENSDIHLFNQFRSTYHQRLFFDHFLSVMLNIGISKRSRFLKKGPSLCISEEAIRNFEKHFPFKFTPDQKEAINDIADDLKCGKLMTRLLQGDVGCGKTVVAATAAYLVLQNNWQIAIMVPTHILARQHYEFFTGLPSSIGFRPVLLTGALKKNDRMHLYNQIKQKNVNLIIGTQALIQKDLSFPKLGLIIVDEQHRFGVRQRALFDRKGDYPHLLAMTATPIPRTLAMTVYADMDISQIKQHPKRHRKIKTILVKESQKMTVLNTIKREIDAGHQAIIVCPMIADFPELGLKNAMDMHEEMQKHFPMPYRVEMLHGRMSSVEKDHTMSRFRQGDIDLLIGTSVIEVGVHAPGVTVLVIEHPERFGLIQLHQLRGRVGRGTHRGLCVLMTSDDTPDAALSRLALMENCEDGFEIAQKDLELRGYGELLGLKQTGRGEIDFSDLFRNPNLLVKAKKIAEKIIEGDPSLSHPNNRYLKEWVIHSPSAPLVF